MKIALYQPDIPQNTGTILRLAACLGIGVDLIEPAGFPMSDRAFRRAGMDYLDQVEIIRHKSFQHFNETRQNPPLNESPSRLILLTTKGDIPYCDFAYQPNDTLLLGRETAGVPENVHALADACLIVPMRAGLRSINVAVTAAMVIGEALRQTGGFPTDGFPNPTSVM
ncbi:MAG: tRNA (cytidine(34)-2'-O)-methyltransferase [Rhizobiales bacterium]|nr:tRNA (cytidine(34)-2'-O)-methyltransferase [Hyphomicrobiales bacterium]